MKCKNVEAPINLADTERQEEHAIPVDAISQNPCYQESGTV
jgi:hypothetical protein